MKSSCCYPMGRSAATAKLRRPAGADLSRDEDTSVVGFLAAHRQPRDDGPPEARERTKCVCVCVWESEARPVLLPAAAAAVSDFCFWCLDRGIRSPKLATGNRPRPVCLRTVQGFRRASFRSASRSPCECEGGRKRGSPDPCRRCKAPSPCVRWRDASLPNRVLLTTSPVVTA